MAVSPADFELYSRVTGRPVPTDRGARMKMAPEVNRFIRNREYERPQKTTLQKGADLLGKAAIIGGALAAGHAIGGGFRGNTAENVGKVADVVQNLAKTGDVGAEGGKVVQNVAKATAGMATYPNEMYGALQQEEMLNNLAQPAVDVQTSVADRGTALADRILNKPRRPGGDLDRLDNFVVDIPPNTGGGDTLLPKKPDVSAQIVTPAEKADEFLDNLTNRRTDAGGLSRTERLMNRERFGTDAVGWDEGKKKPITDVYGKEYGWTDTKKKYVEDEQGDEIRRRLRVEQGLEGPSPEEQFNLHTTGSYFPSGSYNVLEENWKSGYPLEYDQTDPPSSGGGSISPAPIPASPTDIVSPDDPGVQRLSGGIQQGKTSTLGRVGAAISGRARSDIQKLREEPFGAQKEKAAARDLGLMILGRGMGLGPQGGRPVGSGFNPGATQGIFNLPGIRNITGPVGEVRDAIGGFGGWNIPYTGQAIPTIAQAGSNFLSSHPLVADFVNAGGVTAAEGIGLGSSLLVGGAAKDAAKTAIAIGDKLAPFHNKVLVPGTRRLAGAIGGFHGNYLVPQGRQFHQNVLVPAGREFHQNVLVPSGNAALDGIQRNLNVLKESAEQQLNIKGQLSAVSESLLPTTRFTGQVGIEENSQLNDHPDTGLGEIDTAPSRLIQQFSDRRISGEGSLTPGDRSDLSALLSGSSAELGPDETVSGDIEIRTDVGVNDPVNFTSGFYDKTRRPSKGEKAKFISGLKERNKDIYSNASDLPARKEGGKGKMGSMGLAGSMAGVADWEDRDAKDPLHGLKQFIAGFSTKPDLSDNAAEEVGKRMAEREQQGNLFEDDKEQQQGSTKWVRSPDGKLRREKIDDPWDS